MENIKFLEIFCPECENVYRVPIEYCGKDAVCSNEACGIMFSIPAIEAIRTVEEVVEPEVHPDEYSTDTVRIERLRDATGMIPEPKIKTGFDTSSFIVLPGKEPSRKCKVFRM